MSKYRFIRNTLPTEGRRVFTAGQVVELSGASLRHWQARHAIEEVQGKVAPAPAPVEPPAAPPAAVVGNPPSPPEPVAPPPTPVAAPEPAHASNDRGTGNRAQPVKRAAAKSAPGKAGGKSGGNRRK